MKYFHYTEGESIRSYESKGPDIQEPVFWSDDSYGCHVDIVTPDGWGTGDVEDLLLKEGFLQCENCGNEATREAGGKFFCADPDCKEV